MCESLKFVTSSVCKADSNVHIIFYFLPKTTINSFYISVAYINDAISPSTEATDIELDDVMAAYQEQLTPLLIRTTDFVIGEVIGEGVHHATKCIYCYCQNEL